jgi:N-methylhydantoinase A
LKALASEGIKEKNISYVYSLDLRYVKQYHEVNLEVTFDEVEREDFDSIAAKFHPRHDRLYGYSLAEQGTAIELINMRLSCIGQTEKPRFQEESYKGEDPSEAYKGKRKAYMPTSREFKDVDVFDGMKLRFGNRLIGPAIIEQVNTTTFVSPEYSAIVDKFGSYTLYLKTREAEFIRRVLP